MKVSSTANTEDLLLHAGWLRRFAVALVKDLDAAEDIAQETLVAAWQRPTENTGRPWLARVARNLAIDLWRTSDRRERRELAAAAIDIGTVATPEELIGSAQIHRAVAEAVTALEEPFRQTIVLRFFQGASSAAIARSLRIPAGTVRWRLQEGIDRVRQQLDARCGQVRKTWVTALLPLFPRPAPADFGKNAPRPRPVRTGIFGMRPVTMVAAVTFVVGLVVMGSAVYFRHRQVSPAAVDSAADPVVEQAANGAKRTVRLSLQTLASLAPEPASQPGIGEADASSLFAELLQAIQTNAYDDFVTKGSASFKAALGTGLFHTINADLGTRLAVGYQTTSLGGLRRGKAMLWLFRLEFADGGDDTLLSMATEAWQLVGFFSLDSPQTSEKEK
jgi:RNA polymerase sigma-70 factor (ECF subfamily)